MIKPVMAKRWLHPDFSWAICLLEIAPLISCGLAKIWAQCSGGLPHCPCWFEPQQKTCPEAVNAAEWWDPATTCTNFWEQSGILTVYDRKTYIRNVCSVLNLLACVAWRFCRAGRRSGVATKNSRAKRARTSGEAARKIKTACPDSWPF